MKKDGTPDLRIKRTQKAIKDAFFDLVEEKGFEHICVKDITDKAMISRNTFYLHYADKYELLNKMCDDLMRTLFFRVAKQLRRVQKQEFTVESTASIIKYGMLAVDQDKKQYCILFSGSSSETLTQKITQISRRLLDFIKDDINGISDYSMEYIVSGMTGIIRYYVMNGVDNIDEECLNFTKIHLGSIINIVQKSKEQKIN